VNVIATTVQRAVGDDFHIYTAVHRKRKKQRERGDYCY
jgi:hypothetical protein